jgi:hypothetical protein
LRRCGGGLHELTLCSGFAEEAARLGERATTAFVRDSLGCRDVPRTGAPGIEAVRQGIAIERMVNAWV